MSSAFLAHTASDFTAERPGPVDLRAATWEQLRDMVKRLRSDSEQPVALVQEIVRRIKLRQADVLRDTATRECLTLLQPHLVRWGYGR